MSNTTTYFGSKSFVAAFVVAMKDHFGKDLPSITTTRTDTFGVYSVSIVTDTSLDDIVKEMAQSFFLKPTNIWFGITSGG